MANLVKRFEQEVQASTQALRGYKSLTQLQYQHGIANSFIGAGRIPGRTQCVPDCFLRQPLSAGKFKMFAELFFFLPCGREVGRLDSYWCKLVCTAQVTVCAGCLLHRSDSLLVWRAQVHRSAGATVLRAAAANRSETDYGKIFATWSSCGG